MPTGAQSRSRTPGRRTPGLPTNSPTMYPGLGNGLSLGLEWTTWKDLILISCTQGQAMRTPIRDTTLQHQGKSMLMEIITTVDIHSCCKKKERQGKGALISGMKIMEIKSTSMSVIVKSAIVPLEQVVRPNSNLPARIRMKTVLLLSLDRSRLGSSFQRVRPRNSSHHWSAGPTFSNSMSLASALAAMNSVST